MDRTIQPAHKPVESIHFVEPVQVKLSEFLSMYHFKEVSNETTRIDLYFNAGKCIEQDGIPSIVNGLLLSGTHSLTSHDIQESINSRGGFYSSGVSMENATISIHCLREKAVEILELIIHAIANVAFIDTEVDEYIADQKQKYLIGMEKVGFLAQREFQQRMFASEPNYSDLLDLEDFNNVSIDRLKKFHNQNYKHGLCKIAVVGDLSESEMDEIKSICLPLSATSNPDFTDKISNETGHFHVEKNGALQSAIRVGRTMFNKQHVDYLDFLVLNTIVGDYFGSRLMKNIREDKGYTYGIGSGLIELMNTGYFVIGAEVGTDVRDEALTEIKKELEMLQSIKVSDTELALVKNYMLGQLLKSADGPYAMMDLFLSAIINGKDLKIYNSAIKHIREITPERVQNLAKNYLNWEEMTIISAG